MPTVVGKISQEELARLHPEQLLPKRVETSADVGQHSNSFTELLREAEAPIPKVDRSTSSMGVLVLLQLVDGPCFQAADFELWHEPLAPTIREGQAFRATREVCRSFITCVGGMIAPGLDDDLREAIVQRMQAKGLITMRVLDVPKKAFD